MEEFLKLLRTNEKEPVRYDESDGTIYIAKERGEISLPRGNWVIRENRVYEVDFIKMDIDDTKSIIEVLNFLGYFVTTPLEELQRDELVESIKEQGFLEINTLEGVERLFSGEVVVRGVRGEFYPVSYDNFIKVYDILDEGL